MSLQFKLQLNGSDGEKLLGLMHKQSSAIRSAYKMLKNRNSHSQIYDTLTKRFPDLPTKYIDSAIYKAKQYPTDKKVIFGGKALFEKLCKNHLTCETREKLKREWKEKRQGTLISIGSKAVKGNRVIGKEFRAGRSSKNYFLQGLASSEGSHPLPCSWRGFAKGPFSSEVFIGGRGMGQGEEKVSSLRGWGDGPMWDFLNNL